jgi:glycosyltransferase involved in cell wall biosynthesis
MKSVELHVILPRAGPLLDELIKLGIPHAVIRYYWWMGWRSALWKRLGLISVSVVTSIPLMLRLLRWRIDLVCTNSVVVFTGALAAWMSRKPHVWFIHEFVDERFGLTPYLPLQLTMRVVDILSRAILTSSEAIRREYAQYFSDDKMHVAHQAVLLASSDRHLGVPFGHEAAFRCVSVGTLNPGKGHSDAIRATGQLSKRGFAVQLTIIGQGPDRARLEALVRAEGVLGRVRFTGFLANPFPVMEAADVVLVCSRKEGFGRVAVEAMRLGKPVVAAASGAILELVRDGFNGLLYTPGDHEELADKLLKLLQSRSLRMKLGENGRRSVQRFSLSTFGDSVLRQFDAVLRCDMP